MKTQDRLISKEWIFEIIDKTNSFAKQLIIDHFDRHIKENTEQRKSAEEILSRVTGLSVDYMFNLYKDKDVWAITPKTIIKAMEQYAQQKCYPEKTRNFWFDKFNELYPDEVFNIMDSDEYINFKNQH